MRTRTRFSPSPTEYMHMIDLRNAIFEYLIAKKDNGDFILRLDNISQETNLDDWLNVILRTFSLCNIKFDEGITNGKYSSYLQSQRLSIYKEYALKLIDMKKAYYCFENEDSKYSTLEKLKNGEHYVIKQHLPKDKTSQYYDLVYEDIVLDNDTLEDPIIINFDGKPTYNFANAIDDHLMNITHVIRENDHLLSTIKYNLIYEAFSWRKPIYIHLPQILDANNHQLDNIIFRDLYNDGYLPEAIVNYLCLLGYNPNKEIFNLEELINVFDPKHISKGPAKFDIRKLNWINSYYIKKLPFNRLKVLMLTFLKKSYDLSGKSEEWIDRFVNVYRNYINYGKEIVDVSKLFFENDIKINDEYKEYLKDNNLFNVFKKEIENISDWNIENILIAINNVSDKLKINGQMLYMPIRIKISGQMYGPKIEDTIYLLSKEVVLNRLNA